MSAYTSKTGVTSILKSFSSADRERAKAAAVNKVRFATPKEKGLLESVRAAQGGNFHLVKEFSYYLLEADLDDDEVLQIMKDGRKIVHSLTPDFANVVEALLSFNWRKRSPDVIKAYTEFSIDIMVAHNTYIPIGISKCIVHWIPGDLHAADWVNGCPAEGTRTELKTVHDILNRILTAVPMSFDVVIDSISSKFPYFKKPAHVTAGYLYNVLWLIEYKPVIEELVLQLVLQKLLILDVNAPRDEIVETEEDEDKMDEDGVFTIDDIPTDTVVKQPKDSVHPIGHTLDTCLSMLYKFVDSRFQSEFSEDKRWAANNFFRTLLYIFDEVLLPSHNTHHVQFFIFQVCSIRPTYSELFLSSLWLKVQNPNVSAIIRHAAVGYMASYLARAKFVPLGTIKLYLNELSNWANSYIGDSDQYSSQNGSLKANMVFFSVCQSIFYLIAFRAKDLTKDLHFLQLLPLSRIAMSHLNPLRYCLPAVATAFAGVTRTHQLAYCHTVLERNARRKLATVYGHDKAMPEETLETFFPFDPYLLKLSNKYIEPNYLVYKAHDMDECAATETFRRKRGDSEMVEEDDFILADKRQKMNEVSKSQEFDKHFHFGTSPGFNS
ncbi:RNA polymerase I-specific transcription initiation factor RRN3 [Drosophila obscura]|uniref:RNA polymerase I-specific transcription initiation factor RRN3 n=1 Tax=Drosophila obscura TaxID=7282 RepID=UPI000B9FCB83|nr:RNA polymerase I-specific transcription initiation factor RRN3 [Drosophila obscura]XP_022223122.1 RNA polymerase I-specific transcription initiation factor RRN3 [Drosophila obscura]